MADDTREASLALARALLDADLDVTPGEVTIKASDRVMEGLLDHMATDGWVLVPAAELAAARSAADQLACFIVHEFDPDPGPWPEYVTGDAEKALMAELEAEHQEASDG